MDDSDGVVRSHDFLERKLVKESSRIDDEIIVVYTNRCLAEPTPENLSALERMATDDLKVDSGSPEAWYGLAVCCFSSDDLSRLKQGYEAIIHATRNDYNDAYRKRCLELIGHDSHSGIGFGVTRDILDTLVGKYPDDAGLMALAASVAKTRLGTDDAVFAQQVEFSRHRKRFRRG